MAVVAGGLIGLNRERHGRAAGFRTHILVCLGSSLIMLLSVYGFPPDVGLWSRDPARLAAQVVSGIGFLGAGTILREGLSIRGLTTAASLWIVAGIGLAVGSGFYLGAVSATAFAAITLVIRPSRFVVPYNANYLRLQILDKPNCIGIITAYLGERQINIRSMEVDTTDDGECFAEMRVELPPNVTIKQIAGGLAEFNEIRKISFQ